jgi:NAD(P)-dependent dehydrogenase (short-subunit alcohol dehydrogenase family)
LNIGVMRGGSRVKRDFTAAPGAGGQVAFDFRGELAVVIGAASGLTRQVALALGGSGARLVLADIDGDGVERTASEIRSAGGEAVAIASDVSDAQEMDALFSVADAQGDVTLLVNGAYMGSGHKAPEDVQLEDWRRIIRVNLDGAFLAAQMAGRRMMANGTGGSIVLFSSIAGSSALGRGNYSYSVSKGAINQMTRELAIEWAHHGIRVNAVQPCQFLTPGVRSWLENPDTETEALRRHLLSGIPIGRLGEVEDIVGPVLFLLSDAAAMITGVMLPVDGGNLAMNAAARGPVPRHADDSEPMSSEMDVDGP